MSGLTPRHGLTPVCKYCVVLSYRALNDVRTSRSRLTIGGKIRKGEVLAAQQRMTIVLSRLNALTEPVIAAAIRVHRTLGPGLLESVYAACLAHEFRKAGVSFEAQRQLPVDYDGVRLDCGFRLDFIVDEQLVIEVKAVQKLAPVHLAQVLTYLKLTGCPAGLLMNFHVPLLKHGIRRLLNPRPRSVQ